ncbi:hypothetical protein BGZ57DRAFT_750575 [Hyaloscypha finlandica]|nr:hypothetical protein BGZ57DRAFT_750575 [Hyaloscypha finlandica]
MTELADIFAELDISHYLHDFLEQGFDTWETILDITESDFDALGVKLGHRRKLQRKIANSRGVSSDRALASPRHTPSDDRPSEENRAVGCKVDSKNESTPVQGAKRKYRRHPKPDENAPERPPSAYVIFSNKMREELKGRNLSFTEIAKLVGENWQNLAPAEKEPYEQQAFSAKERYNNELVEYKKTNNYKEYAQYLADFKARQSTQSQADSEAAKRPKLEAHASTTSSGTGSSAASQHGGETPSAPKLSLALGGPKRQHSPSTTSPTVLPGYRESIYGTPQQSIPWRDNSRDDSLASLQQLNRKASGERRPSYTRSPSDKLNLTGSVQHAHRTGHSNRPPLLTSESTSTNSTASSSAYFTPRTPMEPPLERALPIPALYPQKSNGSFEHQLPPIRPPSLSPRSTYGAQQSPNGIHPLMDFPSSMAPLRSYSATAPQHVPHDAQSDARHRDLMSSSCRDDNILDPVSALLRAGEIVNQNSRDRSGS